MRGDDEAAGAAARDEAVRGSARGCVVSDVAPIPRLALTREEAADAIGMSLNSFERHVQPTIRLVRLGRMRLVPVAELERWLSENASRAA